MAADATVVGAGVVGLVTALTLCRAGWRVRVLERGEPPTLASASYHAAGMIAPVSESVTSEPVVFALGRRSLELWPKLLEGSLGAARLTRRGSLIVHHPRDHAVWRELHAALIARGLADRLQIVGRAGLAALEPELVERFHEAIWIPDEAHVDARAVLHALIAALESRGAELHWQSSVTRLEPHAVWLVDGQRIKTDLVVDARGIGALSSLSGLRSVRGEAMIVEARDVALTRPVRLAHPRHPLYVVPRSGHRYYVGATMLESADDGPLTVRSALELLSAATILHAGFGEASIVEMISGRRGAFPDNAPRLFYEPGLIVIAGLYRHGFLVAPALAEAALQLISGDEAALARHSLYQSLLENEQEKGTSWKSSSMAAP